MNRRHPGLLTIAALAAIASMSPPRHREENGVAVLAEADRIGRDLGLTQSEVTGVMLGLLDTGPVTVAEARARLEKLARAKTDPVQRYADNVGVPRREAAEASGVVERLQGGPRAAVVVIDDPMAPDALDRLRRLGEDRLEIARPISGPSGSVEVRVVEREPDAEDARARAIARRSVMLGPSPLDQIFLPRAESRYVPRAESRYVPRADKAAELRASVREEARRRSARLAEVKREKRRLRDEKQKGGTK